MTYWIPILLLTVCGTNVEGGSSKKGLSVYAKQFLCDDFKVWKNINWWYDWTMDFWMLHHYTNCTNFAPGFVPMIWGWRPHGDYPVNIPQGAEYVLGFNEPNMKAQANLTAKQAAKHWKKIEENSRGLPLVSPAAAPCGNPASCHCNVTDWFDEFFELCNNCRVDYLATHAYFKDANRTIEYLEFLWKRYGRKIWLTEFAVPNTKSVDDQLQYMKQILPRLEAAKFVYRYSWFTNRAKGDGFVFPSASLLKTNTSELTALGKYYDSFYLDHTASGLILKIGFDITLPIW